MIEFAQDYDHVDMAPRKPELVRIEEAAKAVGRNPSTLRRWIAAGLLQGHRSRPGAPKALLVDLNAARALVKSPPPADPESRVEPPPGDVRPIRLIYVDEAGNLFARSVDEIEQLIQAGKLMKWTRGDGQVFLEYDQARVILSAD